MTTVEHMITLLHRLNGLSNHTLMVMQEWQSQLVSCQGCASCPKAECTQALAQEWASAADSPDCTQCCRAAACPLSSQTTCSSLGAAQQAWAEACKAEAAPPGVFSDACKLLRCRRICAHGAQLLAAPHAVYIPCPPLPRQTTSHPLSCTVVTKRGANGDPNIIPCCVLASALPRLQVELDSDTDAAVSPIAQVAAPRAPAELDPLIGVKVERWWGGEYGWCPGVVSDFRSSSGMHW